MNDSPHWPIRHILVGIPIVLAISYLWGGAMKGWGTSEETILASAALVSVVGPGYTFLVAVIERSYYMVFWAREKIKGHIEEARRKGEAQGIAEGMAQGMAQGMAEGIAEGLARGAAKSNQAWRAWYERMQADQREGRPFNEPPPDTTNAPEHD